MGGARLLPVDLSGAAARAPAGAVGTRVRRSSVRHHRRRGDGQTFVSFEGRAIEVERYVAGERMTIGDRLLAGMGVLGRIHDVLAGIDVPSGGEGGAVPQPRRGEPRARVDPRGNDADPRRRPFGRRPPRRRPRRRARGRARRRRAPAPRPRAAAAGPWRLLGQQRVVPGRRHRADPRSRLHGRTRPHRRRRAHALLHELDARSRLRRSAPHRDAPRAGRALRPRTHAQTLCRGTRRTAVRARGGRSWPSSECWRRSTTPRHDTRSCARSRSISRGRWIWCAPSTAGKPAFALR